MFLLSSAASGQSGLEQGGALFESERFEEAVAFYSGKLTEGQVSHEVHFNLGTVYLAKGEVGKGIYHLELASRMSDDPRIVEQLGLAQSLIVDDIPYFTDFFLLRWLRGIALGPGSNFWAIISILAFLGLLSMMYFKWVKGRSFQRWSYIWISLLALSVIALLISIQGRELDKTRVQAIVLEETSLHEGSDERSEVVRSVSEGIKVRVVDEIGEWQKVQLPDKEVGWINAVDLGVLK